jgi:hypothetical protein
MMGRTAAHAEQIRDRAQPNVTILADPGPRRGENKIKQLAGLPLSWIPTTWIYKGGDLRYALNYGEVRFPAPTIPDRQPVGMVAQRRAIDRVTL